MLTHRAKGSGLEAKTALRGSVLRAISQPAHGDRVQGLGRERRQDRAAQRQPGPAARNAATASEPVTPCSSPMTARSCWSCGRRGWTIWSRALTHSSRRKFYVEHLGADFGDYQAEHRIYHAAAARVETDLRALARFQRIERGFLPNFVFGADDVLVALGRTGWWRTPSNISTASICSTSTRIRRAGTVCCCRSVRRNLPN